MNVVSTQEFCCCVSTPPLSEYPNSDTFSTFSYQHVAPVKTWVNYLYANYYKDIIVKPLKRDTLIKSKFDVVRDFN